MLLHIPARAILTAHSPGGTSSRSPVGPILMVQATGFSNSFITSMAHNASSTLPKNCKKADFQYQFNHFWDKKEANPVHFKLIIAADTIRGSISIK